MPGCLPFTAPSSVVAVSRVVCCVCLQDTRGTAYVVYEDIYDAKNAVDHLSGFNVANRYLIVLYYAQAKLAKKTELKAREKELAELQARFGVDGKDDGSKKK